MIPQQQAIKLSAFLLDIINEGPEYIITHDAQPLRTPGGHKLSLQDPRLAYHLLLYLSMKSIADPDSCDAYGFYCWEKDKLEQGTDPYINSILDIIESDPIVSIRTKGIKDLAEPSKDKVPDFLLDNQDLLTLFLGSSSMLQRSFNHFLDDTGFMSAKPAEPAASLLSGFLKEYYLQLSAERKAVINLLHYHFPSGIVLPLLFVSGYISAAEFACALTNKHFFRGEKHNPADEDGKEINKPSIIQYLHGIRQTLSGAREYLDFFSISDKEEKQIRELIHQGEGEAAEFKSTLRWNLRENKKDPNVEHACMKTLCAFLNSFGGTLLIGVTDEGSIEGIEADKFENNDKFYIHLWNLIKSHLGEEYSPYIQSSLEKVDGKTVCLVRCMASPQPVFLVQKGSEEEFFIRTGPATTRLGVGDAYKYIKERFVS